MTVKDEDKKVVRVSFQCLRNDGSKLTKFIENDDAEKWNDMMKTVCVLAEIHGQPQAWSKLNWQKVIESK